MAGFGLAGLGVVLAGTARPGPFADADDAALVMDGKRVYAARCASCHGRSLQGQPLWRIDDGDRVLRAPALDGTGPGWRQSDADLVGMVRDGHFPADRVNPRSRMPAYRTVLPGRDILAVVAFAKARWPIGLRVLQAASHPGGHQPRAVAGDWRFPANCETR